MREDGRERRAARGVAHVRRAGEGRPVQPPRRRVRRPERGADLVHEIAHEQPVRTAVREAPDAGRVDQEVVVRRGEVLRRVVEIPENVAAERPGVRQECAPAVLLGVVRQPLVQPQILREVAPDEEVLVEADHVLELVHERHRHDLRHGHDGVRAAERAGGIGDNRIENLGAVPGRERRGRDQVGTEEVAGHVATRRVSALRARHERVHLPGHEHDHHTVAIDVRLTTERQRVRLVQPRVKDGTQVIEVRLRQARLRRRVVDVDRDVRSHLEGGGRHGRERARLAGIARQHVAHLERADVARVHRGHQRGRPGRRPERPRDLRRELPLGEAQTEVELLGGAGPCERGARRQRSRERVPTQLERLRIVRDAARRLRHHEILDGGSKNVRREHGAPRRLRRVDRRVTAEPQRDLPPAGRRAGRQRRLRHWTRATGRREERR